MRIDKIQTLANCRIIYKLCLSEDDIFPLRYIVTAEDNYYGLVELKDCDYIITYGATKEELASFFNVDASCKWKSEVGCYFAPRHSEDNQQCVLVDKAELFNYLREITQ